MRLVFSLVTMLIMAVIAKVKGFNPWLWFLAAGIPGLIILISMPSASAVGIGSTQRDWRRSVGNKVGVVVTGLAVAFLVVFSAILSGM